MQVPHNAFVLVADGRKLLILRNEGDATRLDLKVQQHRTEHNPATSEQGTDTPGRSFSSVGSGRSACEPTDFHQIEEDRFAVEAAAMLNASAQRSDYEKLIVIAPPHTLGELRKHYGAELRQRLVGEIHKDLTGHSIPDIEALLIAE